MVPLRFLLSLQRWSSVARWTILGTLGCVAVSVVFNIFMFSDLGPEALTRSIITGTALPILLALPLFFYMSVRIRGLAIANLRLTQVARTDSLTSCLTRGAFTGRVGSLLAHREIAPRGALLMIDADHFKKINDMFGHDQGDEALVIIARAIRAMLGEDDLVGRIGGEEFGVFLPNVGLRGAQIIAERIRHAVNRAVFAPGTALWPLSVSIGGAVYSNRTHFTDLFRIADQRLYSAKQAGRNCAAIADVDAQREIDLKRSA